MPINSLGSKPPILSSDRTGGSSTITTNADFQGRSVSVAGQQHSENFLPAGDARHSAHLFSSTNKYIGTRNIATASKNQDQVSQHDYDEINTPAHDYDEINTPAHDYDEINTPTHDYDEINTPTHDYEEMGSSPQDEYVEMGAPPQDEYVEMGAPPQDEYVEMGAPPQDEYVEMRLPSDDYEEMNPPSENYVNRGAVGNDYEEVGSPSQDDYEEMNPPSENYVNRGAVGNDYEEVGSSPQDEYVEMRSFVDSPKASRARLSRFETLKIRQLGSECGDYVKEVTSDLQKMTQCANNLSASSKSDISAFSNYLIPQHLNCINEYTRAIQILLKAHRHEPDQREHLQIARNQLNALRNKLTRMRDTMGNAIRDKNFSAEAAANYADLRAERKSPARQVIKAQSQIVGIHRFVDQVKYRVNYLASFPSGRRIKAKEETDEIAFCQKSLVQARAALPRCLSDIKKAMDKVNAYEQRVGEQSVDTGKQLTLRERRYTMHLANRLEGRVKRINNTISDSWDKLEKMI